MQNKILLVQAPPWGAGAPPLGIAYLVTFLKSRGIPADIYDLNMDIFCHSTEEIKAKWDTQDFEFWASGQAVEGLRDRLEHWADRILSFNAGAVGFSATFASVPFLNALLRVLRGKTDDRGPIIVVGGGGANYPEGRALFHKEFVDYFVIGEGELPLLWLLKNIQNGNKPVSDSQCLVSKDHPNDPSVCLRVSSQEGLDINSIPFPTFEEFNIEDYTHKDLIPLISSRGCVRRCVFCVDSPIKKPYRIRKPEHVAQEIEYHTKRYQRKRFEFCDLLINGDLNFLNELCDRLIGMNLGVAWGGQAAVRKDMDGALIQKMKNAGCGGLTFGIESFSDHVLKLTSKGVTAEDARNMLTRVKEAGMRSEINLIVGFPGETEKDVDDTIDFISANSNLIDKVNSLNICTIGPGMYIYDHLDEYDIDRAMIHDWYAWFTKDGSNTLEIRTARHQRMAAIFSELHLTPAWQNLKR